MPHSQIGILLLDGEPGWLTFAKGALQRNNFWVQSAATVAEAQQQLDDNTQATINLILADARLLESHSDALPALKQNNSTLPRAIIALFATGLAPQRVRTLYKYGVSDCVAKPFSETDLLALIERTLADYRGTKTAEQQNATRSSKILIVDDDADWLSTLVRYLPDTVENVEETTSFTQAIKKLRQEQFDLVIFDLRLQAEDVTNSQGMDLIQALREEDKTHQGATPIIVVSAFGTPEQIRTAFREQNIFYYFTKQALSPIKYREQVLEALNR